MPARKQPYSAKVKVWLPDYTMEFSGVAANAVVSIFGCLPEPQRMLALHQMRELHESLSNDEAGSAA